MPIDPTWQPERRELAQRTRLPVLRPVQYACGLVSPKKGAAPEQAGSAITVNMSVGGLCMLMDWAPDIREVLSISVERPLPIEPVPGYAEVRWVKAIPLRGYALCFVGLRFLP